MERREHDIMMDMIANQGMSFDNLVTVGLNANNTSLQDMSTYENNEWVREHFKDQYGEFDKIQFEAFYNNAKVYYNALASANYDESMKRQATYHRDNIFAPIEQRRKGPDFVELQMANPYQTTSSIYELGRIGDRTKSIDELAQANKVLLNPTTAGENLENAQWGDTPNDSFWGYFTDTLVMAQYDQDGTHIDPFTGEQVEHKAGDLKLDNTGNFYYEKLDGRDIYGRRVLNKMNVLTTDGSFWNQYDFFDSDDINQKSIGGTVLKNLALVGTMFIPYVGPWIAGLSIATQAAGLLGTLGKMAGGSDAPTFSALEGWSKSVSRQGATTEYAQEHTWCWENFINLIGDVAGQLKEQRFIFEKVPYVFKGANMMTKEGQAAKLAQLTEKQMKLTQSSMEELRKTGASAAELVRAEAELKTVAALKAQADLDSFIKGYNKLGEVLSKGYMTAITVGDTYGEAKAAGASDLDATLLTLGYAAGEYAILNTGLSEWILPELRAGRYRSQAIARALTSVDEKTQDLYKKFGQQLSNFSKEGKKEYTKKLFNIGRDIARAEYANGTRTMTATLASAAGEGVEEVSEELLADFSKGCYDVVKWLQGENTRLNSFGYDFSKGTWNGSELIDRYGMSLVGGFVGGGLTNLGTNYKMINGFNNMTFEKAIQEVVYMARNGGLQDFLRQVDKMQLGDANLSATQYEVDGGNLVFAPGTKENNQDLYIKQALRNQVKMIEGILQANGAVSDSRFLDAQTLGDLRFNALHKSATAGRYLQEYNSLSSKIVRLVQAINDKIASSADANGDGTVTDRESRKAQMSSEDQAAVKNLEEELKETKKQMEDLVSGKRAYEFIADSLFELTTALSSKFTATTFPLFAEQKYGKKFSELTEEDKAKALEDYKNWKTTEGREQLHTLAQIYRQVAEQSSQVIKNHEQTYMQTSQELLSLNSFISKLYTEVRQGAQLFHLPFVADESTYLELAQDASDNSLAEVGTRLVQLLGTEQDSLDLRAILERANTIDPQATEEERTQQRNQIVKDYADKLDEILINNAPAFVKPFLDRGFANTETRNQLTQLLQVVHNRAASKVAEWEQWADNNLDYRQLQTAVNPYLQASHNALNALRAVEQLASTPIEQNLNEFAISIGNEPINLTQLIERLNTSFNDVTDNVTKFNMDEELYKDLNNAIYTLELYQASIRGARTDGANLSNIFGYNATLNEVAAKIEGSEQPQLAEIDKNVADVFDEDIKTNLNKLQFLKRLYEVNQGQKLTKQDRVATKKDLLIYKRLKNIVSILDDDPLKDWEGFLELQNAVNGMTIHDQLLRENKTTINDQQREAFEKEKLAAENAIYDFFQIESNKQKLNDPTKLAEFINPSKLQLYTEAKELLNEGLDNLDDNSLVWWMASRAALRSQDFYYQYRQIIDPQAENPMAPISTQELAIYNNYASVVNGNIFTAFYNAYRHAITQDWQRKSVDERKQVLERLGKFEGLAKDELAPYAINFLSAPLYQNIILTEGIPGSGKSTGVFQSTLRLLKQFHPEALSSVAVVHGANADSAVTLRDDIGLTQDNSKTYGRTEWMKEVNPNWREYARNESDNSYQVPTSDYTVTAENEIRSGLGVRDTTTPPSLIIIDEISKFSAYDLDQVDKFAKKYGITVLVAGDFDQSGVVGGHTIPSVPAFNGLTWKIELSRTNFIRAPKLGVSMRTDNSLKTTNLQKLQAYMQDPNGTVDFNYFQDETGLFGDKVLNYNPNNNENASNVLFQVLEDVQAMIDTLKEGQKIGYIYTDKTSPIYAALSKDEYKNFIDFREGGSAQGLEGQYYIIEANPRTSKKEYLKDIYTGMSRAQQGSLIVAPLEYQGVKFNSTPVSEKISEQISTNTIATFAKKRKDILDKVASEGQVGNIIPRTSEAVHQPTPQPAQQGRLDPGIPATPPAVEPQIPVEVTSAPEVPQVETLTYEDDIAPITQTDVINDQAYQQQIDEASRTESVPESIVIPQGETISIDMLLHTFNTFETGVAVGQDGNPAPIGSQQWMDSRIDSVNGLVKIDQALGRSVRTVDQYVDLIGKLRNVLFNTADKSQIQEKIQNLLGLSGIYCTFALKSSPRPGTTNRAQGREFVSNNPTPYDKGISEQTMFNGSTDARSHEWHPKSIVAIIGTKGSGNLLELPLIALSSPFTLLQTKDINGAQTFSQMFNTYDQMIKQGADLHTIAETLVQNFDGIPQYQELVDLFKLYNFTDAGIFYIDNPQWTPVQDLQLVGPQFITEKGYYQEDPGLSMNDTTNPEAEWITLQDFARNPQCTMTKKVMVSMTGMIDGVDKPIVNAGHPFVLVSFNRNLNNDAKIMDQFAKQQRDPSARQEVKLMYVLPPKASVREYLGNLHKILNKEQGIQNIGNLFTSYKLLQKLMQSDEFKTLLDGRLKGAVEAIQQIFTDLEGKSQDEQKNILYETRDWTTIGGLEKQKIAGLFDAVLANIAYTRVTVRTGEYSFNENLEGIGTIERILAQAGIDGVYHKVKVAKDAAPSGYFMVPDQGSNYTLDGTPRTAFKIHGKLDSYTFRGNMGWLVSSALGKLRQGNNGHSYSTDGQTYMVWDNVAKVGRPGNSDITAPPVRSRQETETERHIRNTVEYVKRKLGTDVSSVFEGKTVQEAQKQIVEQINANNNQVVAFTIGNELLISNKSAYFEGPVYIYDTNGQPVTDISTMVDNNGKYNFTISTTMEGKQVQLDATYDGVNKEMEMIQPMEAQPTTTISVTPENFVQYMDAGRRILEPIFDDDILLANVFNTTTYEEFMDALQNMVYLGEELRIGPLEALLPMADALQAQVINDIIAVERSNDPDKQDVTEENASCPPTIKIKF